METWRELWARAKQHTARRHRHNEAHRDARQCLVCGAAASIRERTRSVHTFCARQCQATMWHWQRVFSLGQEEGSEDEEEEDDDDDGRQRPRKRGVAVLEEEHAELFSEIYFPDEIVCTLVLWAYDFRLETLVEYEEMRALRAVSKQFRRVIDRCVTPHLRFLSTDVLHEVGVVNLARYTGLREITLSPESPEITGEELAHLAELEALTVYGHANLHGGRHVEQGTQIELSDAELAPLVRLRKLKLVAAFEVEDAALHGMTRLQELHLQESNLTEAAFDKLPALRKLELVDEPRVRSIYNLTNLTSLSLTRMRGEVLEDARLLPELRVFRVIRAWHMDDWTISSKIGLRALELVACTEITDDAFDGLAQLESLIVKDCARVTGSGIAQLTALKSLSLVPAERSALMLTGTLRPLIQLRWLTLKGAIWTDLGGEVRELRHLTYLDLTRQNQVRDEDLRELHHLRTLLLDRNGAITDAGMGHLTGLTTLSLDTNRKITDAGLAALGALRFLDIAGNYLITDAGLAPLTALEGLELDYNEEITFDGLEPLHALRFVSGGDSDLLQQGVMDFFRERGITVVRHGTCIPYTPPLFFE